MRKIPKETREHVLELVKKGVPVRVLAQRYNLPLSTIRTWITRSNPELKNRFYDDVLPYEAKIFTMFSPYLKVDIKDSEYEKIQKQLMNELNDLTKLITVKVAKNNT